MSDKLQIIQPYFQINNIPIVISSSKAYVPYLDVLIRSIVDNGSSNWNYDIIVISADIQKDDERKLLVEYKKHNNCSIRFINVSEFFENKKLFVSHHISIETYFRLVLPYILSSYSKIIYLDCDIVVIGDLSQLFTYDLKDSVIGAVRDVDVLGQIGSGDKHLAEYVGAELGLHDWKDYFQAGVLLWDITKTRELISEKQMEQLISERKYRYYDQDVLNSLLKNRVSFLDQKWNVMMIWKEDYDNRLRIIAQTPLEIYEQYKQARNNPMIIHYAGYQKPWDIGDCDFAEYFWKYARSSVYYEKMLYNIKGFLDGKTKNTNILELLRKKIWRRYNLWFPQNSNRRNTIKKISRLYHRI